ncbi:hypothetical protein CDA63_14905 [Hymenobacter amundsenii]|uniref:Uncharacterized protein n=1 Tax=Hymenobacter amundsenii TaxID=2006685 RepID=A0A246FIB4_9BACT|nr:hypothetical protein CDA63_14905 [Hymenobacter amundsenii]
MLLAGLAGCQNTTETPAPLPDYYPLAANSYRIYDVADTTWRNDVPTASRFQFREQVAGEPTTDATGQQVYQVVRSRRAKAADAWRVDSVLTVTVAPLSVTEQFNNRRTVVLVQPAKEGKSWSFNAFNGLDSVRAVTRFYQQVDQPFSIVRDGKTYRYENTVTTANDFNNSLNSVNAAYIATQRTTFAAGVGPVYRVSRRFDNDCSGAAGCRLPFFRRIGQSRSEVLIESGK